MRYMATAPFWEAGIQAFEVALRRSGTFPAEENPGWHMARMLSAGWETPSPPTHHIHSGVFVEEARVRRVLGRSSRWPATVDSAESLAAG